MSQFASLRDVALAIDGLLRRPGHLGAARQLVESYRAGLEQGTVEPVPILRELCENGIVVDWNQEDVVPTPEQRAAALCALHDAYCLGVEKVVRIPAEPPPLGPDGRPSPQERRAVSWTATLERVKGAGDTAVLWFELQLPRFEGDLAARAAPPPAPAGPPARGASAAVEQGRETDPPILTADDARMQPMSGPTDCPTCGEPFTERQTELGIPLSSKVSDGRGGVMCRACFDRAMYTCPECGSPFEWWEGRGPRICSNPLCRFAADQGPCRLPEFDVPPAPGPGPIVAGAVDETPAAAPASNPDLPPAAPARAPAADGMNTAAVPMEDDTAYRPATECLDSKRFTSLKRLKTVLRRNPWIRTDKPSRQRLRVHMGDWSRYRALLDGAGFAALDVAAETLDQFMAEVRQRQAEIRNHKAQR
jgi:hypothetical protein